MFHVKQTINKTFDAQPLKKGCIKCFEVKVKLQQFVKQKWKNGGSYQFLG